MGAPTLTTLIHPERPLSFTVDRLGCLIGVNGLKRGVRWDGQYSLENIGVDAPASAPTVTTPGGGAASVGDYTVAYRYTDDSSPVPVAGDLSDFAQATASAGDAFDYAFTGASTGSSAPYPREQFVEIYRSTADQSDVLYLVARLGNNGTFSDVDSNGGFFRMTVPAGHGLIAGATFVVTLCPVFGYNTTHKVTAVTATTVTTDVAWSADDVGGVWKINGFIGDVYSDADLALRDNLPIYNDDGSDNAYRFGVPPSYMGVVFALQDRAFYTAPVDYTTGTLSLVSGSTTVMGSGTAWTTDMAGRYVYVIGYSYPLLVSTVVAANQLTLSSAPTASVAGASYSISAEPSERNLVYYSEQDEFESVPATNTIAIQENTDDHDKIIGAIARGAYAYIFKERHLYKLSYVRQPRIDANIQLVASRGLVNFRCVTELDGTIYAMDRFGIYAITGDGVKSYSENINNYWLDGEIDWTKSQWFFASADQELGLVRFHFKLTGDSGTRPLRSIAIDPEGRVWPEKYHMEIGGSCGSYIAGRNKLLMGGENDCVFKSHQGQSDHVAAATYTATGGTSSTIVASTTFGSEVVDAPVAIISGTGAGQIRRITSKSSGTLNITPNWTTTPDTTSVFVVGAIEFYAKFGRLPFPSDSENKQAGGQTKRALRLLFEPASTTQYLDVRLFYNCDSSARLNAIFSNQGCGVVTNQSSDRATFDLTRARSGLADSTGTLEANFGGRLDNDSVGADRWVAPEIRGFEYGNAVTLHGIDVYGVKK